MKNWLPIVVLCWCSSALAVDERQLAELLERARVEMDMPGLRAAVRLADGTIVRSAVGLADVEAAMPLNDVVGMPGGSTGKSFVAALTMRLVEEGVLSLDDPAKRWLDQTSWYNRLPNADLIRVRHLLSHSAGIADYPDTISFQISMIWRVLRRGSAYFAPEELIGFVLDKRPAYAPGEGYEYSDTGYLVLGRLLEAATGQTYYDLLRQRILNPLKLSGIRPADQSVLTNITPGYISGARNLKKDGRMKFDPRSEWTGGGLVTNPTMLVHFYAALAQGRVVSEASLAQMLDGGWRSPGSNSHYGYGLFVYAGGRSFGHGGRWPGYRTQVTHDIATGITIAVQTNRDGRLDMHDLVKRIAETFAGH